MMKNAAPETKTLWRQDGLSPRRPLWGAAVAGCLLLSACSGDGLFGGSSDTDELARQPDGLIADKARAGYDQASSGASSGSERGASGRRQPNTRYALAEPKTEPKAEVKAEPKAAPIEQQPVQAPAGMESQAPAPLAAAVEPPASPEPTALAPEPVPTAPPEPFIPYVPVATGCTDDLGTTVIGGSAGDSRVFVQPDDPSRCGGGAAVRGGVSPIAGAQNTTLVATIQFPSSSSSLSPADRTVLKDVVRLYRQQGGAVRVVGHASARTANMSESRHNEANYDVSQRRAEAVGQALVALGVPAGQVYVTAAADIQPAYQEVMPSGEAGNRRAEVYLDR